MSIGTAVAPGIGIFDEVQWGTHLCQLYESNQDLIEVLVPYFRKGLERNALCLWLSSMPLGEQVMEALRQGIPHLEQYQRKGQIQTVSHADWYLRDGRLSVPVAIEHASGALNQAKLRGFAGIWVAGDLSWLDKGEWQTLVTYEETVCNFISGAQAAALCAYPLRALGIPEALDLFRIHQSIVMQREGRWKLIESLEQVKSEKALRDTEKSYKHLFDVTLDGIEVIEAATGRILIANQAAANIFGFASPEQMVGIDPLTYILAEDRERVAGLMAEAMFEKDLHRVMELKAQRTDGSEIWISAVGVRTQYQGRLAGLVSIRDITEQRKAEKALQESQRELQAVFDGVRDGIALFDVTGRLMAVNRRVLEVGGYAADEIVGRSFDQLGILGPQDISKMMSIFAPVLSGEAAPPLELETVTKSGQKLILDVRVTPLRRDNDVIGAIAVLRDITERKRAMDLLQASEQRNRLLVENASEGVLVVQEGFIQFANRKTLEIMERFGYTGQEVKARPFEGFIHSEDRQMVVEAHARRVGGEEFDHVYQFRAVGKNGEIRWMELNAVRLLWDDKPASLVFLNDVTERKLAEDALRESEERYRLIAENSLDVIWTMDMNLRMTYVSPSVVRLTGYTARESMAMTMDEGLTPTSAQVAAEAFTQGLAALETKRGRPDPPMTMELEMKCKDGSAVWTEVTLSFMRSSDGTAIGIMGVARDIDERRRAQVNLKESENRYRLLAENVSDVIWVTDVNLRPTYVSPSIQRLLGFGADESLFRGLEDALSPSSSDKVRDIAAKLVVADRDGEESAELQHPVEIELRRRDGSTVCVDTTVTVIRDLAGHPVQFLGVLRDVTERKQAEEQVQQSCQKLEKTLEGTIQAIRAMVDARDRYTAGHQQRVTELACAIAEAMGLSSEQVQAVHVGGLLHDVGKILLPTEILTKPGRLNEIEFAMIRTHPKAGHNILKSIEFPWPIAKMVLQHHERVNGSGYPDGVRGEEILMEARILAVADVVEAMSSHRPYRPALGLDKALDEITRNRGVLYDPLVADACVRVFMEGGFGFKAEAIRDLY
jgi:PAS domain S-box-containing protein/putative nucleotidyltransferase with HDIG domain